jgi:protein-disulfide isomerase
VSSSDARSSRSRTVLQAVAAVALVGLVVLVVVLLTRDGDDGSSSGSTVPASATDGGGFAYESEAELEGFEPVPVVFYDDYVCADCAEADVQIGSYLQQQADLGVLALEYRPVALPGETSVEQSYAVRAGAAAACVAEEVGAAGFVTYRTALYANQQQLTSAGYEDTVLADLAEHEGLDAARDCIESDTYEGWVRSSTEAAAGDGVDDVPAVQVAGEPVDAGDDGALQLQDILGAVAAAQVEE